VSSCAGGRTGLSGFKASFRHIHEALDNFPDSNVDARLDPAAFRDAQIYPMIWNEPREALVAEYKGFLRTLKNHVRSASQSQQSLLATLQ
jgi:hypothetical protein